MKPYKNQKNPKMGNILEIKRGKPPWVYREFLYIVGLFRRKNINWYILSENKNKMDIWFK